jgi:hypothetical protein
LQQDGWWWHEPQASNQRIRRGLLMEMLRRRFG